MIRPAMPGDMEAVATLLRGSFDPALRPYMVYAQHGIARYLADLLPRPGVAPDRALLVSQDGGGKIAAFAEFRAIGQDAALLSYICVRQDARGRGLAEALIRHHLDACPELKQINLDVFADNRPAIALYRKLGFVETGETYWFVRDLPRNGGHAAPIEIRNPNVVDANFADFGFCELDVGWQDASVKIGRLGGTVLRCFAASSFDDDALLERLGGAFPDARQALLIGAEAPETGVAINRSIRMAGTFGAG